MKVSGIAVLLLLTALQAGAQTTEGLVAEGDKLDGQQQTEAALKVYLEAEKQEAASPAPDQNREAVRRIHDRSAYR